MTHQPQHGERGEAIDPRLPVHALETELLVKGQLVDNEEVETVARLRVVSSPGLQA